MRANPLTPNLRAGFVITASLPVSTVLFISELLAEGVAPIPLDGSTVVEGTVCTTALSSPDNEVRGIPIKDSDEPSSFLGSTPI